MAYGLHVARKLKMPIYEMGQLDPVGYIDIPDTTPIKEEEKCRICGRIREDDEVICKGCGSAF